MTADLYKTYEAYFAAHMSLGSSCLCITIRLLRPIKVLLEN